MKTPKEVSIISALYLLFFQHLQMAAEFFKHSSKNPVREADGSLNSARTATEMDGTLHTDFRKSETSRDIKKYF